MVFFVKPPPPYTRVENFKDPFLNHGSLKFKSRRLKVENTLTGNSVEGPTCTLFSKFFPYNHISTLTPGGTCISGWISSVAASRGHRDISPRSLRFCFPSLPPPQEKMAKICHFRQIFWIFAPTESHFAPSMPPQKILVPPLDIFLVKGLWAFETHPKHIFFRYENRPLIRVFACVFMSFPNSSI